MTIETSPWDPADNLTSPEAQIAYLQAAIEDGDPSLVAAAIGDIARARGMSEIARQAGVTREALYKSLSADGDPKLSTLLGVLRALKFKISVEPA